jgi:glycogen synthase kinase 3 beta
MWSLGCVILEILNGDVVFLSESVEEALLKIQNVLGELPKEGKLLNMYIEHGSVKNCDKLRMTRSKTLRQIAGHDPLLYDLLKKLLAVDPNLR